MRKTERENTSTIHRLVDVLKRLLDRAGKEPPETRGPYPFMTLFLLATFHRTLGLLREAYDYYSHLIALEPRNDALLASRGSLIYGSNPAAAVSDFEQAIKLGTQIVWPYYFLAHHLITHGHYAECWRMCSAGLEKPAAPRIRSALLEFLAISMAGLALSPDLVRRAFEEARRVDPDNERAEENLRRYIAGIAAAGIKAPPRLPDWDFPTSAAVQTSVPQQVVRWPATRSRPVLVG